MAKDTVAQEKKWQVEEAARTLVRAEEIRADKKLFTTVKKELAKQQKAVSKAIGKSKKK